MEEILKLGNKRKLDIDSIKGLLSYISVFPIGSMVMLSDGRRARVVSANEDNYSNPIVCVVDKQNGKVIETDRINLATKKDLSIQKVFQYNYSRESILTGF